MREFNDADRKKKRARISLPDNPGNLSDIELARLEEAVKAAVDQGYVACPTAWKVARESGFSRLDVGAMIDRLGKRVTNCQLGAFGVSKTPHTGEVTESFSDATARRVDALHEAGELTCPNIFALAGELGEKPRAVSEAANVRGYKFGGCQLGCF